LIEQQNKTGALPSDHIPVKMETRVELKDNMNKILNGMATLAQAGVLILSVAGLRSLAKAMQGSINNQCRILLRKQGWL
jgi:hypothetical protein